MDDQKTGLFVEDFGLFFEQFGLPRTAGRILAWLLICDPPHQTMDDLAEALQMSKSSVSTNGRILLQSRLVDRVSLPGERRDFYRINDAAWTTAWLNKMQLFVMLRQMAEQGLNLLPPNEAPRRRRLEEMRDLYLFLERESPLMIAQWQAERTAKQE
jgi:DNA-binding transcriptional regulator GbsR (MarR family)